MVYVQNKILLLYYSVDVYWNDWWISFHFDSVGFADRFCVQLVTEMVIFFCFIWKKDACVRLITGSSEFIWN